MRDGVSLLDQCASDDVVDIARVQDILGLAGHQELSRLAETIANRDVFSALTILGSLYDDGRDMASLLGEMATFLRDLLVFKLSPESGLLSAGFDSAAFSALSEKVTSERLFYFLDVVKTAISGLPRGGSSRLTVEMCIIKMCNEQLSDDTGALLSRISQLESGGNLATAAFIPAASIAPDANATDESAAASPPEPACDTEPPPVSSSFVSSVSPVPSNSPLEATHDTEPPAALSPPAISESGSLWLDILAALKSDPPVYALLSDGSKVKAQQHEGSLIINTTDFFTASLIESEFSGQIKEAAENSLGRDITIRVEVISGDAEESKQGKLESLSAFGIVNFD
jgi:DNA polymerase-3 subunit gamma/tau